MMISLLFSCISIGFAQIETIMYVMKNGEVVFQSTVSGVDNVTFDKTVSDETTIQHYYKRDKLPSRRSQPGCACVYHSGR